jgi:hypothetical protein
MKRLGLALFVAVVLSGRAEASLERAASVARSQAVGGAFVSLADDISAVFVNPAGIALAGRASSCLEYAEPPGDRRARELRLAAGAALRRTSLAFGFYRGSDGRVDDWLLAAGCARKFLEAGELSFISIGANVALGGAESDVACSDHLGPCPLPGPSGTRVSTDIGIIARPIPVVSFGYAAANVLDVHMEGRGGTEAWRRIYRWGMSYFWENDLVMSLSGETIGAETTMHYGLRLRAAVPVELMAGFSRGHASGGIAWSGARTAAVAAFSSAEGGAVTWTGSIEVRLGVSATGGRR